MKTKHQLKFVACFLCAAFSLFISFQPVVAQLPANFQDELVSSDLVQPIALTFLPHGRILVLQKTGEVRLADLNNTPPLSMSSFMTITNIDTSGEHGLINIVLDPNFESNGYFYLYYTHGTLQRRRLSRFTDTGNPATRLASEVVIWEDAAGYTQCCHTGGGLDFAPDGTLYLSTGDDFTPGSSQNLMSAKGKVIRINRDGSIPGDNPFKGNTSGYLEEIYSFGLRNPFRGRFDRQTNRFIMGDVGGNDNSSSWEDIRVAQRGANFGWPNCGDGERDPTGQCTNPAYADPIFSYPHSNTGASIIGGVIYRGTQFPPDYNGVYFYGDYVRGWIRYLTFDASLGVKGDFSFDNSAGTILAIEQAPDGALYYIKLLGYSGTTEIGAGELRRYVYNDGNQPPTITQATANPTSGAAPLAVSFSGMATDDGTAPLSYHWIFGDGSEADGASVTHVYQGNGQYTARLRVSDASRVTLSAPISITVGSPPVVNIVSPSNNYRFRAGEIVSFSGTATDDQPLSVSKYRWSIIFNHNEHTHPADEQVGIANGSFTIPDTGHGFSGNTGYTITLQVTDSDGLIGSKSARINPDQVNINVTTQPSGLTVHLDDSMRVAPFTFNQAKGFKQPISADSPQCVDGILYDFDHWSNGMSSNIYTVPDADTQLTAIFRQAGACSRCNSSAQLDGIDDWVNIPDLGLSGDFTAEAWVYINGAGTNADAILGQEGAGQDLNFYENRLRLHAPGNNTWDVITASTANVPNTWTHYAVTRQGNILSLYINGVLDATTTTVWDGEFAPKALGRGTAGFLGGMLDEVRIWRGARSSSEILANYRRTVPGTSRGLVGYWNFNEPVGEQPVRDVSGNNNDGSLGATLLAASDDPSRSTTASAPLINDCDIPAHGTGLKGEYYDNPDFTNLVTTRVDARIDFDWSDGTPAGTALTSPDTFSTRWSGEIEAPVTGLYTFTTTSDDGVRLSVNGQQIINNWTVHPPTNDSGTITLQAGRRYPVIMEFFENGGWAVAKLSWNYPGQGLQIVPRNRLYPTAISTPYSSAPQTLPGVVQAEDFDQGGEGVAYHDTDAGNNGGMYRMTDVDILGNHQVGWAYAGEWLKYTVNTTTAGTYTIEARVGANGDGGAFHIEVDGVNETGTITVPNTGGWSNFTTVSIPDIQLTAGQHVIRVVMDVNGTGTAVGDFDYFRFVSTQTSYLSSPAALPGIVQSEDFDSGGEGVAYHDVDAGNNGGAYRNTNVDVLGPLADGEGYGVGWIYAGEWLEYTVNVGVAGTYNIQALVGTPGDGATFHIEFDGVNKTGRITIPNTGAYSTYQTVMKTGVRLSAGQHVMRVVMDTNSTSGAVGDFNYLRIVEAQAR